MTFKRTLSAGAAVLALAGGFASAQVTTGSVRGTVTSEAGAPVAGALVTIVDEATGTRRQTSTDGEGRFSVRNLSVSGDYDVTVSAPGYDGERVEDIALFLGDATTLNFALAQGSEDNIMVVGSAQLLGGNVAVGPSSTFSLATLESTPAINRDLKDVVRLDPRVYLDESFADAVQCAGANPRFNSLTVDGLRLNDAFGLNSNGYPTERIPFSYDAIEQVSVELAPFDVEYGSFTACNINAVTKSGTNEFFGGFFADYTNDSLRGDKAEDRDIDNGDFDEIRYGFNVGGPIIQDKLFFFAAYEKQEGVDLFGDNTPTGKGITDAQYQEIVDIAQDVYGYTVGALPTSIDNEDEKLLIKLDWNIVDGHRAAFTYNYNEGFSNSDSDGDPDELPEGNHFYKRGATLNSYAGSLYSDWTDNFSTEVRVSFIDLDNLQEPFGSLEDNIGEVQITVDDTLVYLGPDDSRHANELNYELLTYKLKGDYVWNDHTFTVGYERDEYDVFNLFVQENQGEFRFDSIADFEAGDLERIIYESAAGTNVVTDGAAEFSYAIDTVYVQDAWQVTDALNVVAGIRAEFYSSDDKPAYNAAFQESYGIRNDDNLAGKSIIQPRVGFTYDATADLTFRGGFGLFSGGNPNVWISNNYSNNGVTLYEFQERGTNIFDDYTYGANGRPLFDIPQEGIDAVANATGEGSVNALDPDFEIPSEWKYSLGLTYEFDSAYEVLGGGYRLDLDALYSRVKEAAYVTPISYTQTGTAPDGRPLYAGNDDDFVLTNAGDDAEALTLSAALSKSHDFGLDWTVAYAYVDATDVNPMTSSVAFSNYQNFTRSDAVNPDAATSDYEIPHRFTFNADWEVEFVPNYATTFGVFAQVSEGSPYSYTFGNTLGEPTFFDNNLFYVPSGANDPFVTYADTLNDDDEVVQTAAEAQQGLLSYISDDECLSDARGQIIDRNACNDDWWTKIDLKISQEFPGIMEGHRSSAYIVLENVGNFLNSDWGVLRQQGFPGAVDLTDASIDDGQYVYSNFRGDDTAEGSIEVEPSLWEIRFGFKYDF